MSFIAQKNKTSYLAFVENRLGKPMLIWEFNGPFPDVVRGLRKRTGQASCQDCNVGRRNPKSTRFGGESR
jgi:hypothetical protein